MDLENSQGTYNVKTEVFEGPLDVLLNLIEKRKLFINDISLAKVADDFISHIRVQGELPIADTAQFVLIASTLILIKSKSLLPGIELTEEEEQSIEDLEHRLTARKQYKELSLHVKALFGKQMLFTPLARRDGNKSAEVTPVFAPDKRTTTGDLLTRIKQVIAALPKQEVLHKTLVKKVVSLEEMIVALTERITRNFKMNFKEFATKENSDGGKEEKVSLIVSFLAMLELVKQGVIAVRQDTAFQDIKMESAQLGVPRY